MKLQGKIWVRPLTKKAHHSKNKYETYDIGTNSGSTNIMTLRINALSSEMCLRFKQFEVFIRHDKNNEECLFLKVRRQPKIIFVPSI